MRGSRPACQPGVSIRRGPPRGGFRGGVSPCHGTTRTRRPHCRAFVWYSASMVLTFRTAMLSEGEEVGRVIRAAFTPYVRALGREFPAEGSAGYAEVWERFVAELEHG